MTAVPCSDTEPLASRAPEPLASRAPEPLASRAPEPLASRAPEPLASRAPEPLASRAPEPLASRAPEPLAIEADPQEFRRASTWLRERGMALAVPAEPLDRLELCLNEVLANLVEHGGEAVARQPIELRLEATDIPEGSGVRLLVTDAGPPFDSGQAGLKPLPGSLAEASPGGLGLRLLRAMTDGLAYRVLEEGRNELRIEMHWPPRT